MAQRLECRLRTAARVLLAALLGLAGIGHLSFAREEFRAQVPDWLPLDADFVVLASGILEIGLCFSLLVFARHRVLVGWLAAAFFVLIFAGNIAQYVQGTDAFGLDTDQARFIRLWFQPVLVAWALYSTGAWRAWIQQRKQGAQTS